MNWISGMLLNIMKSKIHRATVTQADLNYVGSLTIDESLMEAAGIIPNEMVYLSNLSNAVRIVTYAMAGPRNSGIIGVNGPPARQFHVGDTVIILAYAGIPDSEAAEFKPRVVFVDGNNRFAGYAPDPAQPAPHTDTVRGDQVHVH
jgi:aspartate 1-decarboxylase